MKRLEPLRIELSGTHLIEASAGTGKTYTITTLYLRLLLEAGFTVDQILVVTFTKAATGELRARVRERLREAADAFESGQAQTAEVQELLRRSADRPRDMRRLMAALNGFDEAAIFTIHGFCARILSEFAFESGQRGDLTLVTDVTPLLRTVVEDFYVRELHQATGAQVAYLRAAQVGVGSLMALAYKSVQWPEVELSVAPPEASQAWEEYEQAVAALHAACAGRYDQLAAMLTAGALKRQRYREDRVGQALRALKGFLSRPVSSFAGWSNELFELLTEEVLIRETKKGQLTPRDAAFVAMSRVWEARGHAEAELEAWLQGFHQRFFAQVSATLGEHKLGARVQAFDDLLLELAGALKTEAGPRLARLIGQRFPAVLIDEFQDTDPTQYEIFSALPLEVLYLIGDPKQAIYAFRGADVFSYLRAARAAGDRQHTLGVNYRSDPGLVRATNALFSRPDDPFLLEGIEFHGVEPRPNAQDRWSGGQAPLTVAWVDRQPDQRRLALSNFRNELAGRVASEVTKLLESEASLGGRALCPGDFAVLTRTNAEAADIQAALLARGVPSVLLGDRSVFDAEEAEEMGRVLAALADPGDDRAVRAALSVAALGVDAEQLARLGENETAWERWLVMFQGWHRVWLDSGFVHAFRLMLDETQCRKRLLGLSDGERRLTNWLHLGELLHRASVELHLGRMGLVRWFSDMRFIQQRRDGVAPEAQQIRLESDARAVQLTTVHKSKGLEYSIVICPSLFRGQPRKQSGPLVFHDPERGNKLCLHLGRGDAKRERALSEQEARAENLRLAYVALTRAKHHTIAVFGAFNSSQSSPLAHLLYGNSEVLGEMASVDQLMTVADDGDLLRRLRPLEQAGVGCRPLELDDPRVLAMADPQPRLAPLPRARLPKSQFRTSSFSALTAHSLSEMEALGRDVDRVPTPLAPPASLDESQVVLASFPRGPRPGDALHRIFERIDFRRPDPDELPRVVTGCLTGFGLDASRHGEQVVRSVDAVLRTELAPGLRLAQIAPQARRVELEFVMPASETLSVERLANALALGDDSAAWQRYIEQVRRLSFSEFRGYLRGFIDLVFEAAGRFYLLDYKSNFLGERASDYVPERLREEMARHHYYLQYHLYLVALVRHLEQRNPAFDYERDVGGALYLFLRGVQPETGASRGVFSDRPPKQRLVALSELFFASPGGRR